MLGLLLDRFMKTPDERSLRKYAKYIETLSCRGDNSDARLLGHAALVYTELILSHPNIDMYIRSRTLAQDIGLFRLLITTHNIEEAYRKSGQTINAAGMFLWFQTLICLYRPELSGYGTRIWTKLMEVSIFAENYLDSLNGVRVTAFGDVVQGDIEAAKRLCHQTPAPFSIDGL